MDSDDECDDDGGTPEPCAKKRTSEGHVGKKSKRGRDSDEPVAVGSMSLKLLERTLE
jgi:hypothetical protein